MYPHAIDRLMDLYEKRVKARAARAENYRELVAKYVDTYQECRAEGYTHAELREYERNAAATYGVA